MYLVLTLIQKIKEKYKNHQKALSQRESLPILVILFQQFDKPDP